MVQRIKEVIYRKNPQLHNTPPFFELFGWGEKNHISPVPHFSGTQRRLFYSLQPDFYLFKFFNIILVIATMHIFSSPDVTSGDKIIVYL